MGIGFINQEQIALLELTFHCVCWISWYMYSHIGFCKVNDAEPNKLYAKEANYVAFVALPIRTIEQSHSNYCFFFSSYYYFCYLCCVCLGSPKVDLFLFCWQLDKEGMLPFHTFSSLQLVRKKNRSLGL